MIKYCRLFLASVLLISNSAMATPFAKWTKTELTLDNGKVQRKISLPDREGVFVTTLYPPLGGEFKYFKKDNTDFQFEVNGMVYSGVSKWQFVGIKSITGSRQGDGAAVTLKSTDRKIELTISFLLYPNSPAIRKHLKVKNLTSEPVSLESVDIEKF